MADINIPQSAQPIATNKGDQGNFRFALVSLTTLFFMWGFITCLNDILIPHLKNVFDLNYTQAMLIQFCFFGAYFIVSIPAGNLVKRLGYQKGIVLGLVIAGLGCMMFYPAAALRQYPVFLAALFVLASGITILQVSANPYVSILGKPETAPSRLTMTQAFNSLGTTIAPFFGGLLILSSAAVALDTLTHEQQIIAEAQAVQVPYLMLASALFVLAAIFSKINLPQISNHQSEVSSESSGSVWQHRHLVLGAVAIFVYVGAEVAIGSFLVNFLGEAHIAGMEEAEAAKYIAYYWGGAMVGRFIGAAVMQKISGGKVLCFNALCASLLVLAAMVTEGHVAMWAILAVGLFNSVMFPTIFSLAINGLKDFTSQGSGILCLAIVGGAIVPLIQGALADSLSLQLSFILPIFCYAYIAYYGISGSRVHGQA
jgi:FHS family L-fucose permease-like MFS transporter